MNSVYQDIETKDYFLATQTPNLFPTNISYWSLSTQPLANVGYPRGVLPHEWLPRMDRVPWASEAVRSVGVQPPTRSFTTSSFMSPLLSPISANQSDISTRSATRLALVLVVYCFP